VRKQQQCSLPSPPPTMSDLASGYAAATHELTWVVGPDAVAFLDGQISQDVASMHRGEVKRSFLLEPRGKLQALLWVLRDDERVGMITWAGAGEALRSGLERFRFRVDAELVGDDRQRRALAAGRKKTGH
jgi:folate-binding Fe-S cluster repair protein YgfZ